MSAFLFLTHISLLYIFRMMRQLNNIHFDTIQGASARQSKIVSSASQSSLVSQQKDEKMKQFTIKEKDVWVGKQDGKFFNEKDYQKQKSIFMKEARTNVVDWYLKDMKKTMVLITLVNFKRQD